MAADDLLDFDFDEMPLAKTSDDYYTPRWIFEALNLQFDIDVASPVGGIPWIPAKKYFTQYDDGLAQDWDGAKVWMNPPYSKPAPWIEKWLENGNGMALVPASNGAWMQSMWENAHGITIMPSNLKFHRKEKMAGIPIRTILCAIGEDNLAALKASGIGFVR